MSRILLLFFSLLCFANAKRQNYGERAFLEMSVNTEKGVRHCRFERATTTSDMPIYPERDVCIMDKLIGEERSPVIENALSGDLRERLTKIVEKSTRSELTEENNIEDCPENLRQISYISSQLTESIGGVGLISSDINNDIYSSGTFSLLGTLSISIKRFHTLRKTSEKSCATNENYTNEELATLNELKDVCLSD